MRLTDSKVIRMKMLFKLKGYNPEVKAGKRGTIVTANRGRLTLYKGYPKTGRIMSACNTIDCTEEFK